MKKINKKILFNIIGFYICWWGSILGAANDNYFIGPLFVVIFLFIHSIKVMHYSNEILFLVICYFIGFLIDTIFLRLNIINFNGYLPENYRLAPIWVTGLWVCFGASVSHSFKWIKRHNQIG